MKKMLVLSLLAAVSVPSAALALQQPAPTAPIQIQDRMDGTDVRSPVQTRATIARQVQSQFLRLDANRDGFLTRDEAQAGRQALRARGARAGVRGNRANRRAADPMVAFNRLDTNRDGVISRNEFASRQALRQQRQATRQQRQAMRGARAGGGRFGGRMFDLADANRDGRLTLQEATVAAYQRFDRLDLNRDGAVTPDERRQGRQQRRG